MPFAWKSSARELEIKADSPRHLASLRLECGTCVHRISDYPKGFSIKRNIRNDSFRAWVPELTRTTKQMKATLVQPVLWSNFTGSLVIITLCTIGMYYKGQTEFRRSRVLCGYGRPWSRNFEERAIIKPHSRLSWYFSLLIIKHFNNCILASINRIW